MARSTPVMLAFSDFSTRGVRPAMWMDSVWRELKLWRKVPLGPVSLRFRLERAIRLTWVPERRFKVRSAASHVLVHDLAAGTQARRRQVAVIVGVGPGFGYALARHLASEDFDVVLTSRDARRHAGLVEELAGTGARAVCYGADATDERSIAELFDRIESMHGAPDLVVYAVQRFGPGEVVDVEVEAFEAAWRHNCLGAFVVGRRAARTMRARGRGTIVFVGSTSSLVGRAGHLNLSVGKFGLRAIAQVMARELWPSGVHVAHAVVDADIAEDGDDPAEPRRSNPDHIAMSILGIHRQPRTAWTSELDLRPYDERFWEHC